MPLWLDLLDLVGLLVVLVVLYGVALVVRRRLLSRHGGTFELSHRLDGSWLLGLGRYSGEELEWFRIFTLAPRPRRRWNRTGLSYEEVREPAEGERDVLYPDHVVIRCDSPDGEVDLAMSRASLTGFQSWLEARTPGTGGSL